MQKHVAFHFDFGSPNSYLAHLLIPGLAQAYGATFTYVPVLLGGIFRATGNRAPGETNAGIENKLRYERRDLLRFTERNGIVDEFSFNPYFPINTLQLMRGCIAAHRLGVFELYMERVFRGMWQFEQNLGDPEVLSRWLTDGGLEAEPLFALIQDPEVKTQLISNTEMAVSAGDFGAPTFHYDGEIYFGKDRIRDLEQHLAGLDN
ncbi:2-hydroxychromene-2-carboxylate isomerase [Ruegeria sp. HKCCA5426]|uniref:2-hydroxychromene-2-carboxylate isomerase n=1 Tax=Ruegeria sp. HKCCA5426 TaxID=2682985 RepID=UPI001489BDE8|nr:2-hydroxychromene-2-carboxylate isomerase [Ruegeria sp. HKCCA5426]